ncbi:MAG: hypothetical protein M0R17_04455 [Candidatus Omnitrophica bacterium]|jgi:oligoribonuclease NrnB/cAMP/cGMP phosphodiesterase (DHH superfamily)|nr:hypothetical protein [Candidatus Omnitrophota bacterium]
MSKTVCVYHSIDLDGWMSAAIVKHWWLKEHYFLKENGYSMEFIGYNYGQPIPNLSEYDKVIMCDISFPPEEMNKLINSPDNNNFVWLDHHISVISNEKINENWAKGIRDVTFAACELTWKYFFPNEPMPEIVRLIGRYDCLPDRELRKHPEHMKIREFQYGARQCISNYDEAYNVLSMPSEHQDTFEYMTLESGKAIYKYLCTDAKQSYKNGFEIMLDVELLSHNSQKLYKFICINKERFNPINFGIDYHKEGYDGAACFHYVNGKWYFSLYNDNGLVDCSIIAKQYGGGGHKGAAGFIIDSIDSLKELLVVK